MDGNPARRKLGESAGRRTAGWRPQGWRRPVPRRAIGQLAGAGVLLVAVACGTVATEAPEAAPAGVPVTAELLAEGRRSYRAFCVQCHGFSGRGDGSSAAHLDPKPRDHTDAELMGKVTDANIAAALRDGGVARGIPNMPAFPHLSDTEVVALVAYVRSLSDPDVARVDIDPAR